MYEYNLQRIDKRAEDQEKRSKEQYARINNKFNHFKTQINSKINSIVNKEVLKNLGNKWSAVQTVSGLLAAQIAIMIFAFTLIMWFNSSGRNDIKAQIEVVQEDIKKLQKNNFPSIKSKPIKKTSKKKAKKPNNNLQK